MPRAIHFEICADDPARAVRFYEEALGWKISKWDGSGDYWLIQTGEEEEAGIDGAIMEREGDWSTINTISVPSVDEFAQRIGRAGGRIVSPKQTIPGVGHHLYCADTEGNAFGILESMPPTD
jgi:predicted enzyme related to lactoylglutathione lyase